MSRFAQPLQRSYDAACAAFEGAGKVRALVVVVDGGAGTYEVVHGSSLKADVLAELLAQQIASLDAQRQEVTA